MAEFEKQHRYWNNNLDAANLGDNISDSAESLRVELQYSSVPDIQGMVNHVAGGPGKCILEVGSGLGANAVLIAGRGSTVLALDISQERLRNLRKRTTNGGIFLSGKILPVRAKAEALPFKDHVLHGACSRAVLIHTRLDETCAEITRCLAPGSPVAFSEPMAHNPLVNLYRNTLAPREWRDITTYFSSDQISTVSRSFTEVTVDSHYLTGFGAFVFQYGMKTPRLFYMALRATTVIDRQLIRFIPELRRLGWFVLIRGQAPGQ